MVISDLCESIKAGPTTSRIHTADAKDAPGYNIYNMDHLASDLQQSDEETDLAKTNRLITFDEVMTTAEGDLIYCLINQTAGIVHKRHSGFLISPNFARMTPKPGIDKAYLLFVLNCSNRVKEQFNKNNGVSIVKRISLKSLLEATIDPLPDLKTQQIVGKAYLEQMHLYYLRKKSSEAKNTFVVEALKKASGIN